MVLQSERKFSLHKPYLKKLARDLRKNSTLGEVLLWNKIKGRQLLGYKFIRQIPINKYIVDFYCRELKLIIEIDGFTHNYKIESDIERQKVLEKEDCAIIRFQEQEVRDDINNVIQRIVDWIEPRKVSHSPTPLKRGVRRQPTSNEQTIKYE